MKANLLTTIALLTVFAVPALADNPNRVTMSWPEFVAASGCVIVDKGGYSNLAAVDGGNCPASVAIAFNGVGTLQGINTGPDGLLGTADDYSVAISDN